MIILLHIPYYLDTVLIHVFPNVSVCAYWSSKNFDTLHGEHIQSEIMYDVLKVWDILQKKLSPIIHVTSCSVLTQDHGFDKVKIKVVI